MRAAGHPRGVVNALCLDMLGKWRLQLLPLHPSPIAAAPLRAAACCRPCTCCPPCPCSGRFMRPAFEGYRVLLTRADGSQAWVNLDREGAPTFLRDYSGGGNKGAILAPKRESQQLNHPVLVRVGKDC